MVKYAAFKSGKLTQISFKRYIDRPYPTLMTCLEVVSEARFAQKGDQALHHIFDMQKATPLPREIPHITEFLNRDWLLLLVQFGIFIVY